jgi:hypothetical protein
MEDLDSRIANGQTGLMLAVINNDMGTVRHLLGRV